MKTPFVLTAIALSLAAAGALAATAAPTPAEAPIAPQAKTATTVHARHELRAEFVVPTAAQLLRRNATFEQRLATDLRRERITLQQAAALQSRAARFYRMQADRLTASADAKTRAHLARDERGLMHAAARAERANRKPQAGDAMDRLHAIVASQRDADQQRWIAHGLDVGRFDTTEVAPLERDQASIVARQAELGRRGGETVDEALQMQHRQDVQDWTIRTDAALI
jgi:hypothetical protein